MICTSVWDFPRVQLMMAVLSSALRVKIIHKTFFVCFNCWDVPASSCGPLLFFFCDRKMRMFCLLEYLFIVRKWKKRARVHKQSWERKETRQAARFALEFSSWQKRQMDAQDGLSVYCSHWKERILGWISSLFPVISPLQNSLVFSSLSPDSFCFPAVSPALAASPCLTPVFLNLHSAFGQYNVNCLAHTRFHSIRMFIANYTWNQNP